MIYVFDKLMEHIPILVHGVAGVLVKFMDILLCLGGCIPWFYNEIYHDSLVLHADKYKLGLCLDK